MAKRTSPFYLGRLYPDGEYTRAVEDMGRYERKFPDAEVTLGRYKGKADGCDKTLWHLQISKEAEGWDE